jgi:hypothetical protein
MLLQGAVCQIIGLFLPNVNAKKKEKSDETGEEGTSPSQWTRHVNESTKTKRE